VSDLYLAFVPEHELSPKELAEIQRVAVEGCSLGFGGVDYLADALERTIAAYAAQDQRRLTANRLAWSGPDKFQRQIARIYGLPVMLILPTQPSALDARYHRRYRNRQGRR
jgi:hypothetical protein